MLTTTSKTPTSTSTVWEKNPTTADLIAATNKITVNVSGIPLELLPHVVARELTSQKIPLSPLAPGKSITEGQDLKEIKLSDGRLLCTAQSDSHGRTELKFTDVLVELLKPKAT